MKHKFKPFQKVLVRNSETYRWEANFYSYYYESNGEYPHKTINKELWKYCIPFEGNEYLLGTTDSSTPKHEYKWGDKVEINNGGTWVKAIFIAHEINQQYQTKCVSYILDGDLRVTTNFTTNFVKNIRPLAEDSDALQKS